MLTRLDNVFYGLLAATASDTPGGTIPQATREAVVTAFIVSTGASDTYYGRNKEKGRESTLKKITLALFAFILVCSIICFIVDRI